MNFQAFTWPRPAGYLDVDDCFQADAPEGDPFIASQPALPQNAQDCPPFRNGVSDTMKFPDLCACLFRNMAVLACGSMILAGCGGGSSGGALSGSANGSGGSAGGSGSTCSLLSRQNWAADILDEWYLFPETLPSSLDPEPYESVQSYIDALTQTARNQGKDRYFTYLTSIAEETAYIQQGSTAGFGVRLNYLPDRLTVVEAFESSPAFAAGIDRGTDILAIGTSMDDLRSVADISAEGGTVAVAEALGPTEAGVQRVLTLSDAGGERTTTVTKAEYDLSPLSPRYGVKILNEGGRRIGYINLRTFIGTAEQQLRDAFAQFRSAGITDVVIDLRFNGGGLVRTAYLMGDLLGRGLYSSNVFAYRTYRAEKSSENETRTFQSASQSIAPTKIAFIGTASTASASELVINGMLPYLGANEALIGSNTYGKPVGQVALDRSACDDRLRVVAFQTENADRNADYYDGLLDSMEASCAATDDPDRQLGDPEEEMVARALDFLAGRSCTAIAGTGQSPQSLHGTSRSAAPMLNNRQSPNAAQLDMPGLF